MGEAALFGDRRHVTAAHLGERLGMPLDNEQILMLCLAE